MWHFLVPYPAATSPPSAIAAVTCPSPKGPWERGAQGVARNSELRVPIPGCCALWRCSLRGGARTDPSWPQEVPLSLGRGAGEISDLAAGVRWRLGKVPTYAFARADVTNQERELEGERKSFVPRRVIPVDRSVKADYLPCVRKIERVVILGANGAMGAGSGEVFAAAGIETWLLARDREKAEAGRARAESMAKSDSISRFIRTGGYEADLAKAVAGADLVLECVSEELSLKNQFFDQVERHRRADAIISTVSSGLSIAAMCKGRSDSFAKHFLGLHLFNPPNVITGCEVIPHAGTDRGLTDFVLSFLEGKLGRQAIETSDTPAFCGNRVGFKVLDEVAQLAEEHGVAYLDLLLGPHTGRAMAPLATIDFVGWDVHKAIVENLHAHTRDEAHAAFAMPAYMQRLIAAGHLGNKTAEKGGFFLRRPRAGADRKAPPEVLVLDPRSGEYRPYEQPAVPEIVSTMRRLARVGKYGAVMQAFLEMPGKDAELMRRVILGYVSYGLGRVGEVVQAARDVDRIMGFGFNWAPPSVLVDVAGAARIIKALEAHKLAVPPVLLSAARSGRKMLTEPSVDVGRFFYA